MSQRAGTVHHELVLGGPDAIRSAIKAALVLWSTLVGNAEVKSTPYDATRQFVLNGDRQYLLNGTHIDSRSFANSEKMRIAYGMMFNLIYVRSDENGRVVGHFTLYNAVAWQFTFAESGGTPNMQIALISNPLAPSQWSDRAIEEFEVPFDWLNAPDYSDELVRLKQRFDDILQHYFELHTPREHARIIDECFDKFDFASDTNSQAEKSSQLSQLIASKVVNHAFGLPDVEKLSAEQLGELLRNK